MSTAWSTRVKLVLKRPWLDEKSVSDQGHLHAGHALYLSHPTSSANPQTRYGSDRIIPSIDSVRYSPQDPLAKKNVLM